MTITYPIAGRRRLDKAEKAKWFRRPARKGSELLQPDSHQVLVYRVNGDYVLDSDKMDGTHERVVQATHVSMVDMRRDAPVVVRLEIPSADASFFEVMVTFVCTVEDPVAVVRGGINAESALWSHLKAHNRIFELGLDHPLTAVNDVRRIVSAQVKAYLTICRPSVPGLTVSVASVEVSSPEVLRKYEAAHLDKTLDQRLAELEQANLHRLTAGQKLNGYTLESSDQEHHHRLADRDHERNQAIAASDADHERDLAARRSDFARREFALNMDTIGDNPRYALMAAFADGRIEATTLSEQLRALDESDREARMLMAQREREERLQLQAADRDDQREARQRKEARLQREHEERLRLADQARADQLRKDEQERADRLLREQHEREDQKAKLGMKVGLLQQMTERGHFNSSEMQADRLLAEVMDLPQPAVDSADMSSLRGPAEPAGELPENAPRDQGIRDEDV